MNDSITKLYGKSQQENSSTTPVAKLTWKPLPPQTPTSSTPSHEPSDKPSDKLEEESTEVSVPTSSGGSPKKVKKLKQPPHDPGNSQESVSRHKTRRRTQDKTKSVEGAAASQLQAKTSSKDPEQK